MRAALVGAGIILAGIAAYSALLGMLIEWGGR